MFLSKFTITNDILTPAIILDKLIQEWEAKYVIILNNLCREYRIDYVKSISSYDSDSESNDNASKLIKEAIKCKAYIDVEYKAIQDIRSELEDCQMVKELTASLQQLSEDKEYQNKEIEKLNAKNWQLEQEKDKLEQFLRELHTKSTINNDDRSNRKTILAEKLENLRNRAQLNNNTFQNSYYCHIASAMNIYSDSEHSISEEDSLEKDKRHITADKKCGVISPGVFTSGLSGASKSTPIKSNMVHSPHNSVSVTSKTGHSEINGNLTQDLKDIHTYLNGDQERSFINETSIIDWEMSQPSIEDSRDKIVNGDILHGREDPDVESPQICHDHYIADNNIVVSSILKSDTVGVSHNLDMNRLNSELKHEKDKYDSLTDLITKLYDTFNGSIKHDTKSSYNNGDIIVPVCSGDQPDDNDISTDPIRQICYIQGVLEDKNESVDKSELICENADIDKATHLQHIDDDTNSLNIFKSLSEASVRLLTEIVNNLFSIDVLLSEKKSETTITDNTSLVMDYLQYLVSLNYIDFSNDDARRHPIFVLVKDLEKNVQNLLNRLSSKETETSGLSKELESYYKEQLNKCYEDISQLKKQLEYSQQLLASKMPIDTTEALFEAKQKLQEELKSVDREYSRQMSRERKRLEEAESQYNELLQDYENMQKKYSEEISGFKLSIDHLQRQHESDKKFIDQQHFEWELERSQHNLDIDNLNRTIGMIKRSSSCSENLSDCGESPVKGKLKKSNSLPKSKSQNSTNYEDNYLDSASQTTHHNIIVFTKHVSRKDLENCIEFRTFLSEIKENDRILLTVVHELSDVIFDIVENEGLAIHLPNLLDLSEKDLEIMPPYDNIFWENIKSEIWKLKEFLINFMKEGRTIMRDYDRVQEELERSLTDATIKQGQILALEDEVQSLLEFQKNLSKDYELLQSMLEEKQIALDDLSTNNLPVNTIDGFEVNIRKLKKEIEEKQNIIDERDEDLYVLKEEKESSDQEKLLMRRQYDANMENHKDMYQDLESELNETQRSNRELHEQIRDLIIKHDEYVIKINDADNIESSLRDKILDLSQDNEIMQHKITSLTDENNLSELRLHELEQQHKNNLEKLNKNLDETERMNRELMNCKLIRNENVSIKSCQTDSLTFDSTHNGYHIGFIDVQEKLLTTIDRLKKDLTAEKDKCDQLEEKHRQFAAQYDVLSNKIFSLETSARDPKFLISGDHDIMNESIESFDRNTFLHASQISLQSFEEDIELNASLKLNQDTLINGILEQFRSVGCQTVSDVSLIRSNPNFSAIDSNCGLSISDWLADLLNEVENVLQSCVIGDDISAEVLAKVTKFRNLLEQMYKRQLKTLLDKISSLDRELQIERKSNLELTNKSDFLMTEVQESESVQRNLKIRLDQVLAENNRISENYRILSDKSRSIKNDLTEQINKFKDELESERYTFTDINRQFKNEQRRREQLESALSVANERTQLVEQSNSEMIKKSRQQMDYQQKEFDVLNGEYAEMFRRCNENKLQLETLQQSLRFQTTVTEKTKHELRETIQSNTEYRTKMNEFIKIYQGKRSKLEHETKELQQLLQISCRREITFIKENETLRMKAQSSQSLSKENERKLKELENCISDLHQRHEEDRREWLKMINGSIDKKKDDSLLSQVNWLLRMLQLRIELLGLHYTPNINYGSVSNSNGRFESLSSSGNAELVMLLQSIKSMQSMINVYLSNNQDMSTLSCGHSSDGKIQYSSRSDKQQSSLSKRPKPTGSSDSLDSLSDTDSSSIHQDRNDTVNNMESINTKIYVLQMNKIVELQLIVNRHERWRQYLLYQKKFILSRIPPKQRATIEMPLLTEEQNEYIKLNYFKFKFKAIVLVVIALRRLSKPKKQLDNSMHTTHYLAQAASFVPYPIFSTDTGDRNVDIVTCNKDDSNISFKKETPLSLPKNSFGNIYKHTDEPNIRKLKSGDETIFGGKSLYTGDGHCNRNGRQEALSIPIHCVSPILERPLNQASVSESLPNSKPLANRIQYNATKQGLSNSYNNPTRSSMKSSLNQHNVVSSLDRNILGKTVNLSHTIRQIDEFGKRLDKYSDRSGGH